LQNSLKSDVIAMILYMTAHKIFESELLVYKYQLSVLTHHV